jgi:hypothetical protein
MGINPKPLERTLATAAHQGADTSLPLTRVPTRGRNGCILIKLFFTETKKNRESPSFLTMNYRPREDVKINCYENFLQNL